jgi:hypothetical protein
MDEIDFDDTPLTKRLKIILEALIESIKNLQAIQIPSEKVLSVDNIWDIEEVKNGKFFKVL